MSSRYLAWIGWILFLCPAISGAQSIGSLSFEPAHPNSAMPVTVVLIPAVSDFCPESVTVQGSTIVVFSSPGICTSSSGTTDRSVVGPLAAGTYQVRWEFPDDIFHSGAVGILTVAAAPDTTPATSWVALLVLAALLLGTAFSSCNRHAPDTKFH